MAATEAVRVEVRAWLERLGALTAAMVGGRVAIEAVDEKRKEQRYRVTMELSMPEGVVTVGPEHSSNSPHDDVYVAVRNAFRAARRPLELYALAHPAAVAIDAAEPGPPLSPGPGVAPAVEDATIPAAAHHG